MGVKLSAALIATLVLLATLAFISAPVVGKFLMGFLVAAAASGQNSPSVHEGGRVAYDEVRHNAAVRRNCASVKQAEAQRAAKEDAHGISTRLLPPECGRL